jgi:Ca2+-binding RTX toxin-like protein
LSDLRVSQWGTTLLIQIYDPVSGERQNQVSIEGYFSPSNTNALIDEIRFDDTPGVVLRGQDIQDLLFTGTDGDDVITGTATNETLRGLGGNDSLNGSGGDDVLDGGVGNDQLAGGSGNDTYRFASGNDRITETSGTDRIVLDAGIAPADVQLYRHYGTAAGDLVLVRNGGPNQLRVVGHFTSGNAQAIEQIVFADGTLWDAAQIAARTVTISGTQNAQTGTTGNDVFQVDHAADTVTDSAGNGTDTIESSISYTLPTNIENLTLTGLINIDATGNSAANILRGNVNMNVFDGAGGADVMIGGAGDDTYFVNGDSSTYSDDTVQELANEGYDTVMVQSHSATLADNVERLVALAFSGPTYWSSVRTFNGNALNNVIDASRLNFNMAYSSLGTRLDGGAGADTMIGGELADTYVVDNVGDVIIDNGTYHADTVESSISYVLADNLENLRLTGASTIAGTGNAFANILNGHTNTAANVLTGKEGDDRYTVGVGDTIVEAANEGFDGVTIEIPTVRTYRTSEFSNIEQFVLGLEASNSNLVGGLADETLIGNGGNNILEGGAGNDTLVDTKGTDSSDDDALLGGDGNDSLTTRGGYDRLEGGAGNDELFIESRYAHAEIIFGRGQGHDVLNNLTTASPRISLTGDLSTSDIQFERDGLALILRIEGESSSLRMTYFFNDEVDTTIRAGAPSLSFESGISWSAADMLRRLESSVLPTDGDDRLFGSTGADNLDGLAGYDIVYGGAGDDIIAGGADRDDLWGEAGADTLIGGDGDDDLDGGSGADILNGGSGYDTLNGRGGADTYYFESGWGSDSIYDTEYGSVEDAAIDEVVFGAGISSNDIWLAAFESGLSILNQVTGDEVYVANFFGQETGTDFSDHIERIRFADGTTWDLAEIRARSAQILGTDGVDVLNAPSWDTRLFGLAGNDTLNGGAGNDLLDGGAGADKMAGGAGNDSYVVDSTSDTITEVTNGGVDSVQSSVTFTLSNEVENLTLTGSSAINGTGNSSSNLLIGNSGNNTLNGGSAGADSLIGGLGNDTYVIARSSGITITENANEGTDLVQASATFSIASFANVENVTLTGTGAINATGNSLANVLIGNSGNNTLSGGAGNDTLDGGSAGTDSLVGGAGDDTYIVGRTTGITLTESASEGTDTVQSSVTFTIASLGNIENITLTSTGAINATGNGLANVLIGNSGNNTLTGGAGDDTLDGGSAGTDSLVGGTGNDIYIVNRTAGVTITENASAGTDTVQASVTYTIASLANLENITLTGTGAINATGNAVANVLIGNAGNNTLTGAAGSDTLTGGNGADIYSYSSGHGADIINNSGTDTAQDRLAITNLTRSQMTFTRSTNDLVITRNGTTTDNIRVLNWFTVTNSQLDFVQFSDQTMTSAQINALFGSTLAAQQTTMLAAAKTTDDGGTTVKRNRALPWEQTHRLLGAHLANFDGELIGSEVASHAYPVVACDLTDAANVGSLGLENPRRSVFAHQVRDSSPRARIA